MSVAMWCLASQDIFSRTKCSEDLREDEERFYFYFYFFVKAACWCWMEPRVCRFAGARGYLGHRKWAMIRNLFWSSSAKAGQEPPGTKSEHQRSSCPWPVCLREQALGLAALHMAGIQARTSTPACLGPQHHPESSRLVCSELTRSPPGPVTSVVWPQVA